MQEPLEEPQTKLDIWLPLIILPLIILSIILEFIN